MLDDVGAFLVFGPIAGLAVALIVVVVWIARDLRRASDGPADPEEGKEDQGKRGRTRGRRWLRLR